MSQYENYHQTAGTYDQTRVPIGVDIILETFGRHEKPLDEQRILDAGCGTGNYTEAILKSVGEIVALDGNEAMLREAEGKLSASPFDNFELNRCTLPGLAVGDESVDGIMINQVIHHFDPEDDYKVLRALIGEASRALGAGGHFVINTCGHTQLREAYWYASFMPLAVERVLRRYPPVECIMTALNQAGFCDLRQVVPVEELFFGEAYFDLDGPGKAEWRAGDSLWALLSEAELSDAMADYDRVRKAGQLPELFERYETVRKQIGQTVFISGRKQ